MRDELWALLVYDKDEPVRRLERMLLDQGVRTRRVRSLSEARAALEKRDRPLLVLTDTSLPDGAWGDVLEAARGGAAKVPVIVVSALVNMCLYLDVLEKGAYDFVVPPLTSAEFAHVIRGVILKGSRSQRRRTIPGANQGLDFDWRRETYCDRQKWTRRRSHLRGYPRWRRNTIAEKQKACPDTRAKAVLF